MKKRNKAQKKKSVRQRKQNAKQNTKRRTVKKNNGAQVLKARTGNSQNLIEMTYQASVTKKLGQLRDENRNVVNDVFLNSEQSYAIPQIAGAEIANCEKTHQYHHGLCINHTGLDIPSFVAFEVGCTPSFAAFNDFRRSQGHNSYGDYLLAILTLTTDDTPLAIPESVNLTAPKQSEMGHFIYAHFIFSLKERVLASSIAWCGKDSVPGFQIVSRELI